MIEGTKLDEKIDRLEDKLHLAAHPIIGDTTKEQWDEIFEYMNEIQADFKEVRYQQKSDREQAWFKFNGLRNTAFESKNEQFEDKSKFHYKELLERLYQADYEWRLDSIAKGILWGEFRVKVETMKERGVILKNAGTYFRENKHEMTKTHKAEVHERFQEVKEAHDIFWGRVRDYREEQNEIYEERKQAKEEDRAKATETIKGLASNGVSIDSLKTSDPKSYEVLLSEYGGSQLDLETAWNASLPENQKIQYGQITKKGADGNAVIVRYGLNPVTGKTDTKEYNLGMKYGDFVGKGEGEIKELDGQLWNISYDENGNRVAKPLTGVSDLTRSQINKNNADAKNTVETKTPGFKYTKGGKFEDISKFNTKEFYNTIRHSINTATK